MKTPYFDGLDFLFFQKFFKGCNKTIMEGTKENPAYMSGQVKEKLSETSFVIVWKGWVGKNRPGIITPAFVRGRKNVQIGESYFRNVKVKESDPKIDINNDMVSIEISIVFGV